MGSHWIVSLPQTFSAHHMCIPVLTAPSAWSPRIIIFHSICRFAFLSMSYDWNHILYILSGWLLSPFNKHWSTSMILHSMMAYFFVPLNNLPLYECPNICINIYQWLPALGDYSLDCYKTLHGSFSCTHSF